MNWAKLSAASEILSSVAILITLVYLAIQTQQNAEAIMASTRQEVFAADQEFLLELSRASNIEDIRYKPELTDHERVQLGFVLLTFVRMRESTWTQYQNGVLDEETWESYRNSIASMLGTPNGMKFWRNYAVATEMFDPQFMSYVSELLATEPVRERSIVISAFD